MYINDIHDGFFLNRSVIFIKYWTEIYVYFILCRCLWINEKNRTVPTKTYYRSDTSEMYGIVLIVEMSWYVKTSRSFPHSWLITGFVTRLTRRMSLVEQELLTLLEHLSSSPVFSGVRVTRSLVLCVCFVDHCLSFCTFSFGHCVFCSSSIYGLWIPLWYL